MDTEELKDFGSLATACLVVCMFVDAGLSLSKGKGKGKGKGRSGSRCRDLDKEK